jgi:hypothetical protein
MDHVSFDAMALQQSSQPEAVASGFESDDHALDGPAGPLCLPSPNLEDPQQPVGALGGLLQRPLLETGNTTGHDPSYSGEFYHRDDRPIGIEADGRLGHMIVNRAGHGASPFRLIRATKVPRCLSLAP